MMMRGLAMRFAGIVFFLVEQASACVLLTFLRLGKNKNPQAEARTTGKQNLLMRTRMIVTPIPIFSLFIATEAVVIAVRLVSSRPILPVHDNLIAIPRMIIAMVFVINAHVGCASVACAGNQNCTGENDRANRAFEREHVGTLLVIANFVV